MKTYILYGEQGFLSGEITAYRLLDETGRETIVNIKTLKQAMKSGQVEVYGLKLTQDGKLIKDQYAINIIRLTIKAIKNHQNT